nr:hypothetical protein [Tanacetum cinerariifolium]
GNLLERSIQDVLTIIENKSKVLIRITSVLPPVETLSQNSGIISKDTFQQPQLITIKGELKSITTRSGLGTDGPTVPTPPKSITLKVDERVEETYTNPDLAEYTIKVPPPPKMLKALLSNKEKLQELANTHLNENCSADSIDQKDPANLAAIFVDPIPEMFTDEHAPDYSSPSIFDVYDDDFLEVDSYAENVYDDPFDSKEEKIKDSKLLIDELDR